MALKLSIIQFHSVVGNVNRNVNKLKELCLQTLNKQSKLDLIVTSELALSGYTPLDELYKKQFLNNLKEALDSLVKFTKEYNTTLIFSDAYLDEYNDLYNAAYIIQHGKIVNIIKKQKLVNYDIFNENRYFLAGKSVSNIIEINKVKLAVVVCEDLWHADIITSLKNKDISGVISINASPYDSSKHINRLKVTKRAAATLNVPVIYANTVGGIDGIVFDGNSFVIDKNLYIVKKLAFAEEDIQSFLLSQKGEICLVENLIEYNDKKNNSLHDIDYSINNTNCLLEEYYQIIQLGFRDFINDNSIKGVIIGLSGGIDSALSAVIAADTLGSNKIVAVSIPSKYNSSLSKEIIEELTTNLGIKLHTISLDNFLNSYKLDKDFNTALYDNNNIVWENLQSRIRGNILMAISNSYKGYIVLCNGNKSELATGYYTLYGDSCGAFNLLKDLYKTEVFNLARWRNYNISKLSKISKLNIIPEPCIIRAPSAELSPNQTDEKELLPYNKLDLILEKYIEYNMSYKELLSKFSENEVNMVLSLLKNNEYKRKQSVIGIKLKCKSFGKEWQYPITNGFKYNEYSN